MEVPGMHNCPLCGKLIDDNYPHCPYCYKPPSAYKKPSSFGKYLLYTCMGIIAFSIFYAIVSPKESNHAPDAVVYNSSYDASVKQVERYLKINLKDPDSYQSINWSTVIDVGIKHPTPHRYVVRHKYRAKNSFGGYVISNQLFYLDDLGNVIDFKVIE